MENGKLKSSVGMKFGIVSSRQKIKLTRVKKSAQKFSVGSKGKLEKASSAILFSTERSGAEQKTDCKS
jgi:hypothetical protein